MIRHAMSVMPITGIAIGCLMMIKHKIAAEKYDRDKPKEFKEIMRVVGDGVSKSSNRGTTTWRKQVTAWRKIIPKMEYKGSEVNKIYISNMRKSPTDVNLLERLNSPIIEALRMQCWPWPVTQRVVLGDENVVIVAFGKEE